jgi:transposase
VKTFAEFLKPVRKHLLELTGQPDQLTLVFDAGSSSRRNLEDMQHYVTPVRPSSHLALLEEAARELSEVQLTRRLRFCNAAPDLYDGLREDLSRHG